MTHTLLVVWGFLTKLKAVLHSTSFFLTTTVGHVLFAHVPVHNLWTCGNVANTSSKYHLHLTSHHQNIIAVSSNTRPTSREIYIKESITSTEILSKHPQMQDESINTIQETQNSQFRLVLSVTPCMPRTSSLESVNHSSSTLLFSPTSSPAYVPTPESSKDQLPPPPLSLTNSLTSFHNTSSQHDEALSRSPKLLFSSTPTSSTIKNKWPSPLPPSSPSMRKDIIYTIM